jgi:putative ABC transport system ATP-binding protein
MSSTQPLILETVNLKKTFTRGEEKVEALKGVSLQIRSGEFVSIMGPSGSGKSSLLHLIGGLDRPTSGQVKLSGSELQSYNDQKLSEFRRRNLGFIFQFFNLMPTLSALENVALPMLLDGAPLSQIETKAKALLTEMGLAARLHHRPDQLSGGEMQRVAIARALIADPKLIVADEPTGNLDSKTGHAVLTLLANLVRSRNLTLVLVTHDPKAAAFGNRLITLQDGLVKTDVLQTGVSA